MNIWKVLFVKCFIFSIVTPCFSAQPPQPDPATSPFKVQFGCDGIRQILYEEELLDIQVIPGMTVPLGLEAMVSIRTKSFRRLRSIFPETARGLILAFMA